MGEAAGRGDGESAAAKWQTNPFLPSLSSFGSRFRLSTRPRSCPSERADRACAGLASQPLSDEAVDARVLELRQRESDLDQREAEFEADVQFREDRIERWRTELEELEQTLDRRERDIVSYVDQLQGVMSNGDDAWWSRPAGGDGGVSRYDPQSQRDAAVVPSRTIAAWWSVRSSCSSRRRKMQPSPAHSFRTSCFRWRGP